MRHLFATLMAVVLLAFPWLAIQFPGPARDIYMTIRHAGDQIAAALLGHRPKTVAEIQAKYSRPVTSQTKVRILLVPGHEPHDGGTRFGSAKERDIVVAIARDLKTFLEKNSRYEVFMTRDENGWNPALSSYFRNNWSEIEAWQKVRKQEITQLVSLGQFQKTIPLVEHQDAPRDMATRLYGINKWAGENDMDILIHIHLNDYPGHGYGIPGEYSGFAIYIPERQYLNSQTTGALAPTIFRRLAKYNHVSNLAGESEGIVEDQELIAIGSYNTLDAASMLIEYGYIYEPQFTNPETRALAAKDLAYQTYIGLMDFFDLKSATNLARFYDTVAVPYEWENIPALGKEGPEIFAMQTALLLDGVYPPSDKDKNDCPRTGRFGPCTKRALGDFQKKYGVAGEPEVKTVELLNSRYGLSGL